MGKKKAGSAAALLATSPCPCGSGRTYSTCCEPLHRGAPAATPEALMRSRYSAYALGLDAYVLSSWATETRPAELFATGEARPKWFSLKVEATSEVGDMGTVTFLAKARTAMGVLSIHEHSHFRREHRPEGDFWVYVDGDMVE